MFESEHSNGAGPASRSLLFRGSQLLVLVVRLITPIAYLYVFLFLMYCFHPALFGAYGAIFGYWLFTAWMLIETLFFPYYLYIFTHLDYKNADLNHFGSTSDKRRKLVMDCISAIEKAAPANISSGYHCNDAERNVQKVYNQHRPSSFIGRNYKADD